jgi:pimeloyl-ACP methyl ester carboxylesterase
MGHELHDLIEDSQLVVWDGTGHCPMIEHPGRFNELVDEFVGQDFGRSDGEALPTGG